MLEEGFYLILIMYGSTSQSSQTET